MKGTGGAGFSCSRSRCMVAVGGLDEMDWAKLEVGKEAVVV